jgi:hypothetical protein
MTTPHPSSPRPLPRHRRRRRSRIRRTLLIFRLLRRRLTKKSTNAQPVVNTRRLSKGGHIHEAGSVDRTSPLSSAGYGSRPIFGRPRFFTRRGIAGEEPLHLTHRGRFGA